MENHKDEERCKGYTFEEWLLAAGRDAADDTVDLRSAWLDGANPSEFDPVLG